MQADNRKLAAAKKRKAGMKGQVAVVGKCAARRMKNGNGAPCKLPSGFGTEHPGIGRCKYHGGLVPTHQLNAAKHAALFMGAPKDINPLDALIWCIHITAGEVEWLTERMHEIQEEEWYEHTVLGKQMHILAKERQSAVERLAKFSKDAIGLGIAERAVRLAESYGSTLARLLKGLFLDLEPYISQDGKDMWPLIVRKHLILLETTGATGSNGSPLAAIPSRVGG